jgi:hypothetical protein
MAVNVAGKTEKVEAMAAAPAPAPEASKDAMKGGEMKGGEMKKEEKKK